jgi:hypothetical protein
MIENKDTALKLLDTYFDGSQKDKVEKGDYVIVKITKTSLKTLHGIPIAKSSIG